MQPRQFSFYLRWTIAIVCTVIGIRLLSGNSALDNYIALNRNLVGVAVLLLAVALTAHEIVGWALTPIQSMFDSLFMPKDTDPPPADYKLTQYYLQQGRYEEAYEECAKIIRFHPMELEAYLSGMEAAFCWGKPGLARKLYGQAKRRSRSPEAREHLNATLARRAEFEEHSAQVHQAALEEQAAQEQAAQEEQAALHAQAIQDQQRAARQLQLQEEEEEAANRRRQGEF